MIKKYSLLALQAAINRTLALDESTPTKLSALAGKVIKIIITPLNVAFFIRFQEGEIQLTTDNEQTVDTIIQSSPLGLIRLSLLPASKVRSLFNDKIKISGDIALGQQVKKLFDDLSIDWEGHLAQFTGDVVAYQIGSWVKKGLAVPQQMSESFCSSLTEYLQEEIKLFPCQEAVDDFFQQVDTLHLEVERLAAHIKKLSAKHEAS